MNHSNPFSGPTPSFKKPPIAEVALGIRFNISDKLKIPHIGQLWNKFRQDYPKIEHAPPIASGQGDIPVDPTTGMPSLRVWFVNESEDQLIQFQVDRFHFNWRRKEADYPRYPYMIKNFEKVFDTNSIFFKEYSLGPLQPIECELTYINHFKKGLEWNNSADLRKIFSDSPLIQKKEGFLPEPEAISWRARFPLGEGKGSLTVKLDHGTLIKEKNKVYILDLTARGMGESTNKEDIFKWFDLAHEWVVRGFTDLTTPEIQKIWEREE
ncbi:MAG TPA: TIGR04255 family protein [Nitrospiria bacterium]|jgi:uncharacterized protein (TIGR04255 family)